MSNQININNEIDNSVEKMKTLLTDVENFHKSIFNELQLKNKEISVLTEKIDHTYAVFDYLEASIDNMNNKLDEGGQKKQELLSNCSDVIRRFKFILDTKK
jgi:hypothetical protein